MDSLLSGVVGALIATILAIVYQVINQIAQRRFEVMLRLVDYLDELGYLLRNIKVHKDLDFSQGTGLGDEVQREKYMVLCDKVESLLTSSSVLAYVALVYGDNSSEVDMFNELRKKIGDATLALFQANQSVWEKTSKDFNENFEKEIEPLQLEMQLRLLKKAGGWTIFFDGILFLPRKVIKMCANLSKDS